MSNVNTGVNKLGNINPAKTQFSNLFLYISIGLTVLAGIIGALVMKTDLIIKKTDYTEESETAMLWVAGLFTLFPFVTGSVMTIGISWLYMLPLGMIVAIIVLSFFFIEKIEKTGLDKVLGDASNTITALVGGQNKTCEEANPNLKKDGYLLFSDPDRNCYACPPGFKRTANPVTGPNACVKKGINESAPSLFFNTVQPASKVISPPSCKSQGYNTGLGGKFCWKCPNSHRHNLVLETDGNKKCTNKKCVKRVLGICVKQETRAWQTIPHNVCPSEYLTKKVLGKVKCLKPPSEIPVSGGSPIKEINGKPVSDVSNWKTILLSDKNLRLSPSAIKYMESKGYKINLPTPDIMVKCGAPNDTTTFDLDGKTGTFNYTRMRNIAVLDPTADTACGEILSNAVNLGSLTDTRIEIRENESDPSATEEPNTEAFSSVKL